MELVREILAAHRSGISRDGLLAWVRLRGDPQATDAQLDAALAALGDEVVDVQGFLYLRSNVSAPAGGTAPAAGNAPAAASGAPAAAPAATAPPGQWRPPGGPILEPGGWRTLDGTWAAEPVRSPRRTMAIAAAAVGAFVMAAGISVVLLQGAGPAPTPAPPTGHPHSRDGCRGRRVRHGRGRLLHRPVRGGVLGGPPHRLHGAARRGGLPRRGPATRPLPFRRGAQLTRRSDVPRGVRAYTGFEYSRQEVLDIGWFAPTQGAWYDGTRELSCYLRRSTRPA